MFKNTVTSNGFLNVEVLVAAFNKNKIPGAGAFYEYCEISRNIVDLFTKVINKRSTELSSVVEKQAIFTGLKNDVKYTIKIRTMVNGRTLCQVKLEKKYVFAILRA